ncbi:MAG: hypothetical protein AB1726_13155 [Planctomycetota bacterium]
MSRERAISGGILVLLGLIGWLVWGSGLDFGVESGPEVLRPPGADRLAAADERPVDLRANRDAQDAVEDVALAEGPGRVEVPLAVSARPADLEIRCVGPGDVPAAGAAVRILESGGEERGGAFFLGDVDALFATRAELPRTADGEGRLWIPAPAAAMTWLVATAGELWGFRGIGAGAEGPIPVRLAPDVTLRARVVDEEGSPLPGAAVAIRHEENGRSHAWRRAEARGAEAIAIFPHAQETVRALEGETFSLSLEGACDPPVEHPLNPPALPTEIVTLVAPSCGTVEVRVLDAEGEPLAGEGTVSLGIVRAGEPRDLSRFAVGTRREVERPIEAGRATFAPVGLGLELEIVARRHGSDVEARTFGPGPARAGAAATFTVRIGVDHPVVLLRAVDGEGAPIAAEELHWRIDEQAAFVGGSRQFGEATHTDAEGRFRVDLARGWIEGDPRSLFLFRGPENDPTGKAEVDLGRDLPSGLVDLGTVVLAAPPLFVAGRVVASGGEPIAGARLELARQDGDETWWMPVWSFRHAAKEDGTFAVRGAFAGERFCLAATALGRARAAREFRPGEAALVLVLDTEGAFAGRIVLDESIPRELVQVMLARVEPEENSFYGTGGRGEPIAADGSFRVGGLSAGEYTAHVKKDRWQESLFTASGIATRSGETTRDPRFDPLDLRGLLYPHRITFVFPAGDEALEGEVRYGPAGAEELDQSASIDGTKLDLLTTAAFLDLEASPRGFRPERREGVGGEIEIRLRPGFLVRLHLGGDAVLPAPPLHVKAALAPSTDWGGLDWYGPAFDANREVLVRAPLAGRLQVIWLAERREGRYWSGVLTDVDLEREHFVEIRDVPGEQTVEVTLTQEEMDKIVASLR